MAIDRIFDLDEREDFDLELEEFVTRFRDRRGSYSVGRVEDDPEMLEYEEMLDLGRSLQR